MTISQPLVDLPLPTGFPLGFVGRERLVRRLDAPVPVALVVAPAGHGKSTTVAEWADSDPRPTTWLSLADVRGDGGPPLLAAVVAALDGSGPPAGAADVDGVVARCAEPRSLVLDDLHVVTSPDALTAIAALADRIPHGSRLTLLSRREPPLPLGRLRARRRVVELRRSDLAMTGGEAACGVELMGVHASTQAVEALVRRTEGWPAAIDLAARAAADAPDPTAALGAFTGEDRLFAEYVRDEILSALSATDLDFLVRTSVLDRLTGPLCDAVVGRTDSASTLHALAGSTGLLVPLDPGERWYRHHRLFVDVLRARLALSDPATACVGHTRAGHWHAEAGDIEPAVVHAAAAGDAGAVGDLLFDSVASYVDAAGGDLVHRWIERFSATEVRRFPSLSLAAARSAWTRGELDRADHLVRVAGATVAEAGPGARRAELHAASLVMRASIARGGLSQMTEDAARAARDLPEHSGWIARSWYLEGVALHLLGHREAAAERLENGARRAAVGSPDVRALCLAQLALLADDRGAHDDAAILAARARADVDALHGERVPIHALVLAVSAMTLAERGSVDGASRDARDATRLLDRLTGFVPWFEAETHLALARTELRLSNVAATKDHLHEAMRILRPAPEAQVLRDWIEDAWARTDAYCAAALVAPALTMAELRVLRLLPTHLSFGEIAERLFVSANTIKTQAHAVYRKLDASSRSGAVTRGRELGLLDA